MRKANIHMLEVKLAVSKWLLLLPFPVTFFSGFFVKY